jgi:hypothetical protein
VYGRQSIWQFGENLTASVHLNSPRNIRASEVVTRRVLLRREER